MTAAGASGPIDLTLAPEMADRARLGLAVVEGVTVREADRELAAEIAAYADGLRRLYPDARSAEVPGAAEARTLYKDLGLDPTKVRPSSEALLRRVLKGEALYVVNTLVDSVNYCSLRAQLPFGLYDRAHVVPPVVLRLGRPGELYEGIRKGPVNVEGRPTLADAEGAFGNPTSDSARTCVRAETRDVLVTVYAPAHAVTPRLTRVLDDTAATLTRHCGGLEAARRLLG